MTPPKPFALLDTTDLTVLRFDALGAMKEARAELVGRGHECISFQREGATYWIDGMNLAQIEKIMDAFSRMQEMPVTNYWPMKGGAQ